MTRFNPRALRDNAPAAFARVPRAVVVALAALGVAWLAFLVSLLVWGPGDYPGRDVALYVTLTSGAALLVVARALAARRHRAVWWSFAAGTLALAAGDVLYAVLGPDASFPTAADLLYVAFYPIAIVGVLLFVRRHAKGVPLVVWADAIFLSLAVAGLAGASFIAPLTGTPDGGLVAIIVAAAYPIGDFAILLAAAIGSAVLGHRRGWTLIGVSVAMAIAAVADLAYWSLVDGGLYVEGTWLDALWPLAAVVLAASAWLPVSARAELAMGSRTLATVPSATLIVGAATLVYGTIRPIPGVTIALAVAGLLGVLVRIGGAVRSTVLMMDAKRDATTDDLTGLLNRRGFTMVAEDFLERIDPRRGLAFLLIDLDGFKCVNDTLGHEAGDAVLASIADRLEREVTLPGAALARLGGDEFVVIAPQLASTAARELAERLRVALGQPTDVTGTWMSLDASVGIALAPRDGEVLSALLRRADIAMYRAKADGLGVATFDPSVDLTGELYHREVAALRRGIDDGELTLHFQPKVRLADGEVDGVEALVRWNRPGVGLVYPVDFLPLASRSGLMQAVTTSVIRLAADQYLTWRQRGIELSIAVNVPAPALLDERVPERIAAFLLQRGLPGSALQVEITEEDLMRDRGRAREVLARLRGLGIRAAIDDYGTGYSSLVYLHDLVVDEVKIDRSYISTMVNDERSASIVKSTIDLAHTLGMRVTAEGIEDSDVAQRLAEFGCDTAQGYYWTRPLAADAFAAWWALYREAGPGPHADSPTRSRRRGVA